MNRIGVLGIMFSWIFLVLLTHEIHTRPIETIEVQPSKWYHIQAKTDGCQGEIYLTDLEENEYSLFQWGKDEIVVGMSVSIGDGGIIAPEIMIDNLSIKAIHTVTPQPKTATPGKE